MSTTATIGRSAATGTNDRRSTDRLRLYTAIAAASFVSYILHRLSTGEVSTAFAVVGLGACGWSWLVTRALFEPPTVREAWWPRIVVGIVAASSALAVLAPSGSTAERVSDNVYALSGSAALLLAFVEPFNRYSRDMPSGEKRFRLVFLTLYAVLVAASMLGLWAASGSPEDAVLDNLIKIGCAVVGLVAAMAAVGFRLTHPLIEPVATRRPPTAQDARLAERLMRLLRDEGIDSEPDLRIADVAARLGEPEYRVSQCISAALGFPNFNRLINHHRIERARAALADPTDGRSILVIAFDCGFGSIGPFNRAFRDQVGTTPRAYRSATKASNAAA
jgi:AraC-like DNA-binding protein